MPQFFGFLSIVPDAETRAGARNYVKMLASDVVRAHGVEAGGDDDKPVALCHAMWTAESDQLIVTLSGAPVWKGQALRTADSDEIMLDMAACYRAEGVQMLDKLNGSFALAVVDPIRRRALVAIDRMGVECVTYATDRNQLVFGSSATEVAGFGRRPEIREQALYDFLIFHMIPGPATVYDAVSKLPPASALIFDDGTVAVSRYWSPRFETTQRQDTTSLSDELHEHLGNAVRNSGLDEASGAFLSGGLDSSSIAGTLAANSKEAAKTFSVGFGESEYDELEYARIANRHFGCEPYEYHLSPKDIVDSFERIAAAYDEPFGNSSAVPTYYCAKLAVDNGVTHLLAGDGGDEIFGGNERYVRQRVFEAYGRLPAWLRSGVIEPISRRINPDSSIMPLRKARSYVDQALIPLPERFESWNLTYREGVARMLKPEFASSVERDAPMAQMREVWEAAPCEDLLGKMLWYDWHFTLAYNDLRKVGTMCELAGVRVSYPLLDDAVVELSTRVPSSLKISGTELRSFFKGSMKKFLPEEILSKEKHGFGLPFGVWLRTDPALRELVYSFLSDLKSRQYISGAFIDDLIEQHRTGHASYYGYAIWDLAMLEAWFQSRANIDTRQLGVATR